MRSLAFRDGAVPTTMPFITQERDVDDAFELRSSPCLDKRAYNLGVEVHLRLAFSIISISFLVEVTSHKNDNEKVSIPSHILKVLIYKQTLSHDR